MVWRIDEKERGILKEALYVEVARRPIGMPRKSWKKWIDDIQDLMRFQAESAQDRGECRNSFCM